jgi:hypothetical protein
LRRASLGGHHAGTVPGAAKVEEPAEDPIGSGDFKGDADCGEMLRQDRATGAPTPR